MTIQRATSATDATSEAPQLEPKTPRPARDHPSSTAGCRQGQQPPVIQPSRNTGSLVQANQPSMLRSGTPSHRIEATGSRCREST